LSGGQRRPQIIAQPTYGHAPVNAAPVAAPAPANPANGRRTGVILAAVSLAAIITIVVSRQRGAPPEPAALPAPPSHVITAVSRTEVTSASIQVGEYLDLRLPGARTYSTVLEQTGQVPVVEALTLPGQQPQLRADSTGHAVIEVMSSPICTNSDGCAYQRTLVGTLDLTVTP
jgi:hypothetical protein